MNFWFPPPQNPLYETYRDDSKFNSELGRIASSVYTKYPEIVSVDEGANIGDTAAIIRSVCPAPIVCIEGDEMIGRVLNENLHMLGDTTAVHVYLSDSREDLSTKYSQQLASLMTLNFQQFDDVSLMAA